MRLIPALCALLFLATPTLAQGIRVAGTVPPPDGSTDAVVVVTEEVVPLVIPVTDETVEQFQWRNRLVVVFADTDRDPAFQRQMELILQRPEALAERDVVVLTDTDPAARSAIRTTLRPRGFALVIVDKDSRVLLRKPAPWDVREITRSIDKTPLRQQEMRERRDAEAEARGLSQ